jgi:hypothetical protein
MLILTQKFSLMKTPSPSGEVIVGVCDFGSKCFQNGRSKSFNQCYLFPVFYYCLAFGWGAISFLRFLAY